jgi:translation initiation factor 5B
VKIPGLLVIDTPGHAAYVNLRKRGGSIADIAIFVVDVISGFEMQSYEALDILKMFKTPFIVAANKVDLIPGWKPFPDKPFLESFEKQDPYVQKELDGRLYTIMGTFSRLGFRAERFDKITDFTKTIAIVPVSAKTGEGLPELLAILVGLTQQYMQQRLLTTSGPAKGTILEVKEEVGLGITVNAIIYDGVLRRGDTVVLGGKEKPIVTKVRTILLPKPLDEIRDPRDKFTPMEAVSAAAGVKFAASDLENALAGAPLYVVPPGRPVEDYIKAVSEEVEKVKILTDKVGVVLKADTLGSLEAIIMELENNGVPIRIADVGDVSRRDVIEAAMVKNVAPLQGVLLSFNVKVLPDALNEAKTQGVKIFQHNVIYHLIEDYINWVKSEEDAQAQRELEQLILPGKIKILPACVFRRSKPAIFGVEVLAGRIRPRYPLIRSDGKALGEIAQVQDKGKAVSEATIGMQVAISMPEPIIGRHINEGDILYVKVPENHVKILLTKFQTRLSPDEIKVIEELTEIMRKQKPY